MENTSLPNSLIRTITELHFLSLGNSSCLSQKVVDFMSIPKPGFWMIEVSSIAGQRKEVGNSSAIIRFICYYRKNGEDIRYCTETIEGELLIWENCRFYCLLPYNFDWSSEVELVQANLDWAENSIKKHGLSENLDIEEQLFFNKL